MPPDEPPIQLSPFVVETSTDTGYVATQTLAGTRLNTSLKEVGAAVSVYTEEFLADINAQRLEDILTYTNSTEGAGTNGNFFGLSGENSDQVRDDPSGVNRVRGLAPATRTRDYFPSDIPSDAYNFGPVTINRGPNAILAGIGSPGGIIDVALRKAMFKDSYQAVSVFGQYGTHREELHLNKVLVPNRLAVRADLLNKDQRFRQEPTFEEDRRAFLAATWRLREAPATAFLGRTTVRANYEKGSIEGVPPNPLTPVMSVTSWFGNADPLLDKWRVNGALQRTMDSAGNTIQANRVLAGFPLYRSWALIYPEAPNGGATVGFTDPDLAAVQGFMGTIPGGGQGPGGFLRGTGDPNRTRRGFARTRLTDRRIFDFYNELLTGEFDYREQDFDAVDVRLEQLFLGGDAGAELTFNRQNFERWRDFPIGSGDEEIYIDANEFLSIRSAAYPNGIPNPNFGRPFIISRDVFKDQRNTTERDSYQATAFVQHDFTKGQSGFARWLGRHTLSGLYFNTEILRRNRTFSSTWDPAGQLPAASSIGAGPGLFASQVNAWFYIGDSLLGANGLGDMRLRRIRAARPDYGQTYTLRVWDPAQRQFVTGTSTPRRILSNVRDQREEVTSQALTLQSHWLRNHVTTLVGWRKDESEAFTSDDLPRLPDGNLDEASYALRPASSQAKDSWTKSVVARYPGKLPFESELRAYWNDSENFNPVGQRRNIWNEELGSPSAQTRELGVMLSLARGKLDLRINRFETKIKDDSVSGVGSPYTYINAMIVRTVAAHQSGLVPSEYGYRHPEFRTFEDVARAFFATIPQRLREQMGPERNFDPRFVGTGDTLVWEPDTITNRASVSDTVSKGVEVEAVWNPTRSWRVSLGIAKNEAVKGNVAREELVFADEWIGNLRTMYNGVLLQGWRNPPAESSPLLPQYRTEHLADIETQAALSGTRAPEIRKWRANLVTRYEFREGKLRGFQVGGAVRWQDKVGIGYPYIRNAEGDEVADIAHPYYGPDELQADLTFGYTRKVSLFGRRAEWSVALNVRNLVGTDELIPIRANADGSYGTVRIPPDRVWSLRNSIRF